MDPYVSINDRTPKHASREVIYLWRQPALALEPRGGVPRGCPDAAAALAAAELDAAAPAMALPVAVAALLMAAVAASAVAAVAAPAELVAVADSAVAATAQPVPVAPRAAPAAPAAVWTTRLWLSAQQSKIRSQNNTFHLRVQCSPVSTGTKEVRFSARLSKTLLCNDAVCSLTVPRPKAIRRRHSVVVLSTLLCISNTDCAQQTILTGGPGDLVERRLLA